MQFHVEISGGVFKNLMMIFPQNFRYKVNVRKNVDIYGSVLVVKFVQIFYIQAICKPMFIYFVVLSRAVKYICTYMKYIYTIHSYCLHSCILKRLLLSLWFRKRVQIPIQIYDSTLLRSYFKTMLDFVEKLA